MRQRQRTKAEKCKRLGDVVLALALGSVTLVPSLLICVLVKATSPGPVLYWSQRIGLRNRRFMMPKFRSMRQGTPVVASHLLSQPDVHLTPIGDFLRRTSLDELPQIWSILVGDMSFVGPRPALFNQNDLIGLRTELGVHELIPGLTGWAQVMGRDGLAVPIKADLDAQYLLRRSFTFDSYILYLTLIKVLRREGVTH